MLSILLLSQGFSTLSGTGQFVEPEALVVKETLLLRIVSIGIKKNSTTLGMARRNARRIKSGWWDSYSAFPVVIKAQLWESQFICWESPSANRVIMGKYQEKSPFWDGLRRLHEKVDHQRAQALFYRKKKSVLMRLFASLWPSWFLSKQKSFPLNLSWLEPGLYPT